MIYWAVDSIEPKSVGLPTTMPIAVPVLTAPIWQRATAGVSADPTIESSKYTDPQTLQVAAYDVAYQNKPGKLPRNSIWYIDLENLTPCTQTMWVYQSIMQGIRGALPVMQGTVFGWPRQLHDWEVASIAAGRRTNDEADSWLYSMLDILSGSLYIPDTLVGPNASPYQIEASVHGNLSEVSRLGLRESKPCAVFVMLRTSQQNTWLDPAVIDRLVRVPEMYGCSTILWDRPGDAGAAGDAARKAWVAEFNRRGLAKVLMQ